MSAHHVPYPWGIPATILLAGILFGIAIRAIRSNRRR